MASSKLLKERIESIQDTMKITNAMYLISSSKLRKARQNYQNVLPYFTRMRDTISRVVPHLPDEPEHPFFHERDLENPKRAYIVLTADKGMAGAYNQNLLKFLREHADQNDRFYVTADNLEYGKVAKLAAQLRELYISKQVDQIDLLYHHFKNMVQQILTHKIYLPLSIQEETKSVDNTAYATDYILEPSVYELQQLLFPKMLDLQIYTTLLDTTTSEHAARMMAMQTANDNANELIRQLTLQYNKTRQQAITNELLDIMGGASQSS